MALYKKAALSIFFSLLQIGYSFAYHLYQLTTELSLPIDSENKIFSVKGRGYFSEIFFLQIFLNRRALLHPNQKYALE